MDPAQRNIRIVRGDDFSEIYRFKTAASTPVDLTGWTAEAKIQNIKGLADYTMSAVVTDAANGEVTVSAPKTFTATLPARNADWYLALITPASKLQTYVTGDALPLTRGGNR